MAGSLLSESTGSPRQVTCIVQRRVKRHNNACSKQWTLQVTFSELQQYTQLTLVKMSTFIWQTMWLWKKANASHISLFRQTDW